MGRPGRMDLLGMLNEPAQDDDSRLSVSSRESSTRPVVPALQTNHSSSARSTSSFNQDTSVGPHPPGNQTFQSPVAQYHNPDRNASAFFERKPSFTSYSSGTPATPYTPGSNAYPPQQNYFGHGHQSPTRTPSIPYHGSSHYQQSPTLHRFEPPGIPATSPRASSTSITPFGPPLNEARDSLQPSRPSPVSFSDGPYTTPHNSSRDGAARPSPSSSELDRSVNSPPLVSGVEARRKGSNLLLQSSARGESLSVSPKTRPKDGPPRSSATPEVQIRPTPSSVNSSTERVTNARLDSSRADTMSLNHITAPNAPDMENSIATAVARERSEVSQTRSVSQPDDIARVPPVTGTKRGFESSPVPAVQPQQKRRKVQEIPIWAQPAKHVRLLAKYQNRLQTQKLSKPEVSNGNHIPLAPVKPKTKEEFEGVGPLGAFEKNILGDFAPQDEHTRRICDWLYVQLILKNQMLSTSQVGEAPGSEGHIEIEAKIGTIVDRRTNERLKLPISTEAVLTSNLEIGFESEMSLQQHKTFNELLNEALKQSHAPPDMPARSTKPRMQMAYEHTREVDSFYPLPDAEFRALPDHVKSLIIQNGKTPRVRITRDQKTGQVLAKIIKARISDIHIYSPGTAFDYRISINLEANWDGDVDMLTQVSDQKPSPDRHKDRVSYKHNFCQIDLTQVKPERDVSNQTASHELEIELDSTAARTQAEAVRDGKPNQFPELIQTLLDNIRILTRAIKV